MFSRKAGLPLPLSVSLHAFMQQNSYSDNLLIEPNEKDEGPITLCGRTGLLAPIRLRFWASTKSNQSPKCQNSLN